jgi:anti-sigma regulatory factor (Ser/Thr protein kinase)
MDNNPHLTYKIEDRSYLSFIKREIHNTLIQAGFSPGKIGEIDIIVSELTSNLIKHAETGELIYRISDEAEEQKAFEIISLDNGKGISDISRMMRDGISTSNTLGQGLGAIQRLSDFFQLFSIPESGTIAVSRSLKKPVRILPPKQILNIRALQVNYPGEQVCGDGYFVVEHAHETRIFVGDGLGHGPHAHEAVQEGIKAFQACESGSPVEVLRFIHQKVKKTRGLVATVAILDHHKREWRICGIGNINTRLYQGLQSKNHMSYNGIVGLNIPNTMNDYVTPADPFQTLIMCSDGIRTRWDLARYPGLLKHDPLLIASVLFKEQARRNDDMTILVAKINL